MAANAARNARGTPSVVLALSTVRRAYNDLMLRAAGSRRRDVRAAAATGLATAPN